jgi:hypothetical protein
MLGTNLATILHQKKIDYINKSSGKQQKMSTINQSAEKEQNPPRKLVCLKTIMIIYEHLCRPNRHQINEPCGQKRRGIWRTNKYLI